MFIEFSAENYLSIKDRITLSAVASRAKARDRSLDDNATFSPIEGLRLLKCCAIYGANASGKSNLFAALRFMKSLTLNSSRESQAGEALDARPFLLELGYEEKPSEFRIVFLIKNIVYEYEFAVTREAVVFESLKSNDGTHEVDLFTRDEIGIKIHRNFPEGRQLDKRTRKNALFLSVCANFDGPISVSILNWFRSIKIISGLQDVVALNFTKKCLSAGKASSIGSLLKTFNLGIQKISIGEEQKIGELPPDTPMELKSALGQIMSFASKNSEPLRAIKSTHTVFNNAGEAIGEREFDLAQDESEGSKKLVALSAPIVESLTKPTVMFIDEFDARLHPLLSRTILKIFNSSDINHRNAQLFVTTHDTNLLDRDLLRRDQIWFVEKDRIGATHIASMVEYKVRNDSSFEKDYLVGKYGAIPLLGSVTNLACLSNDEIKEIHSGV